MPHHKLTFVHNLSQDIYLVCSSEQPMYRHLPCLADFPTPAVNLDRGESAAREEKQHLAPLQQNIPRLVPVRRTLSDKPSSAVRSLEKLLKALLIKVFHYSMKIKALPKWGFFQFFGGFCFGFFLWWLWCGIFVLCWFSFKS